MDLWFANRISIIATGGYPALLLYSLRMLVDSLGALNTVSLHSMVCVGITYMSACFMGSLMCWRKVGTRGTLKNLLFAMMLVISDGSWALGAAYARCHGNWLHVDLTDSMSRLGVSHWGFLHSTFDGRFTGMGDLVLLATGGLYS